MIVNDCTKVLHSKSGGGGGKNGVANLNLVNFLRDCIQEEMWTASGLSALQLRPLEVHQAIISFVQSSIEDRTFSRLWDLEIHTVVYYQHIAYRAVQPMGSNDLL